MYINASQTRKKIAGLKTETEIAMIFTHEPVKCSKATSVIDEIIITKAELQAIDDAIAICSEEASEGSEIWVYTDSQMTLQRLKAKSNVNSKLFNNIRQNLTTKSMSYLHTVSIKSQRHRRKRSSESIDQRRDTKKIGNRHQEKNNHELHQKANRQRGKRAMTNCMKRQHQKRKPVSEAHSEGESELQVTKEASENRQADVFNVYTAKNETWLF